MEGEHVKPGGQLEVEMGKLLSWRGEWKWGDGQEWDDVRAGKQSMVFSDGALWTQLRLGVISWDGETAPWLPSFCSFREEGRKPEVLILLCSF